MKISMQVRYAEFAQMARDLSRTSGERYEKVLKLETASIIKICALNAGVASVAKIKVAAPRAFSSFTEPGGSATVVVNSRRFKGRVWFSYRSTGGSGSDSGSGRAGIRGVGAVMVFDAGPEVGPTRGWHLRDEVWQDYLTVLGYREQGIKKSIQARIRARGLQRLSWIQVGDALGVPLSTVSPSGNLQEDLVRAARTASGRKYLNGIASVRSTLTTFSITVRNSSPLAVKNQGQAALDRAVAQRLRGFQIAVQKGVLLDLQARAARWRGIFVRGQGSLGG